MAAGRLGNAVGDPMAELLLFLPASSSPDG